MKTASRFSIGTTSACAENTMIALELLCYQGNYLRVRGEYLKTAWDEVMSAELPPRARRILGHIPPSRRPVGTTSACAENTFADELRARVKRNYLRVRGEYLSRGFGFGGKLELPPRARRILPQAVYWVLHSGTTSACAENTKKCAKSSRAQWNYLRVRGEYSPAQYQVGYQVELPPRARRIRAFSTASANLLGTTSACAENT